MFTAIVLTVLFGVVWGALWGTMDAVMYLKGIMASEDQMTGIFRSIIAMFVTMFLTGLLIHGGQNILSSILALVVCVVTRPYVIRYWRW